MYKNPFTALKEKLYLPNTLTIYAFNMIFGTFIGFVVWLVVRLLAYTIDCDLSIDSQLITMALGASWGSTLLAIDHVRGPVLNEARDAFVALQTQHEKIEQLLEKYEPEALEIQREEERKKNWRPY
jgi:hypothetical protein